MYKKEHKKLQELQVIQASNFLLLSKLFSNLTINNNFRFHLPISSEKERKLSQINFNLKKISKYINGTGGGQNFYSTAGGDKLSGIDKALSSFNKIISS